jgi:hypothetical protein
MTTACKLLASILACMVAFNLPLFAWDAVGHMAVAYVAYQHLNLTTKNRVHELLKLHPDYHRWFAEIPPGTSQRDKRLMIFMIASRWADRIKSESGYTDDGTDSGFHPDGDTSVQNIGYSDHLRHKYWHFVDIPFSQDGTKLPAIPTPNAETQIRAFRTVLASNESDQLKSYDLVWLVHLVGDVHQPLHAATRVSSSDPRGDGGGTLVKLCAAPCPDELHAFWDRILTTSSSLGTAIRVGNGLPDADPTLVRKKDAADWIHESFEAAQQSVYITPIASGDGPFRITPAYRSAAKELAKKRIALAGVRLANLLNDELK